VNVQEVSECPSAEALTLIMEGKASRRQRQEWMRHIDGCSDCRTVLAEAAAYLEDWKTRTESEKPAPWFEAVRTGLFRRASLVPALVAVALLIVFVVPIAVHLSERFGSTTRTSLAMLVQPLMDGPTSYSESLWREDASGASFTIALEEEQIAFRIGVYLVDLEIALHEENSQAARESLRELETLITLGDPRLLPLPSLTSIGASIDSLDFPGALSRLREIEGELSGHDHRFLVEFGEWSETSRLAALGGRTAFFHGEVFTQRLEAVRARELPDPVSNRLEELERLVAEDGELELPEIERELRGVILLY
jgi:hypothetical protein